MRARMHTMLLVGSCAVLVGCAPTGGQSSGDTSTPVVLPSPVSSQSTMEPTQTATESPSETSGVGDSLLIEDPVPIGQTVEAGGLLLRVTGLRAITTEAAMPGEVAGPGLEVDVEVVNSSSETVDLDTFVVNLYDSSGAPAGLIDSSSDVVQGALPPGRSTSGSFQFTVATDLRSPVTVEISVPTHLALLTFTGDGPQS